MEHKNPSVWARSDWFALLCLLIFTVPVYFVRIYDVPVSISSDEIVLMGYEREFGRQGFGALASFTSWSHIPALPFLVLGKLAYALGDVDLLRARLVHAFFGVLGVVAVYALVRSFQPALIAWGSAMVVATNHAFVGISRMAMRDNIPVLLMSISALCLLRGLRRQSWFLMVGAGSLAGLSLYNYLPGVILIPISLLFIFIVTIWRRKGFMLGLAWCAGCLVVALPLAISFIESKTAVPYVRQQFFLFAEGRELQKNWVVAQDEKAAIQKNIINGLTVFNNKEYDYGYIYHNPGHGFADPITGLFVWIGLISFFIIAWREKSLRMPGAFFALAFVTIWLVLALLVTKSPNYTRLLIILPFAGFFTAYGVWCFVRRESYGRLGKGIFILVMLAIVVLNLSYYHTFAFREEAQGHSIGNTARYIEARHDRVGYTFYLMTSPRDRYYDWGGEAHWRAWLSFFARGAEQQALIVAPEELPDYMFRKPFSLLLSEDVYERYEDTLARSFPEGVVHDITPDARLKAFEVAR